MEAHSDRLNSHERIGAYFVPQLSGERDECCSPPIWTARAASSNARRSPAAATPMCRVDAYKIARNALLCGAAGVAVAHNHPSGPVHPSAEDIQATGRLRQALGGLGIELVDHCLVARGRYTSIDQYRRTEELKRRK